LFNHPVFADPFQGDGVTGVGVDPTSAAGFGVVKRSRQQPAADAVWSADNVLNSAGQFESPARVRIGYKNGKASAAFPFFFFLALFLLFAAFFSCSFSGGSDAS